MGEALLNSKDPPIYGLYVSANNPAVTCPDARKLRLSLAREDLFTVVHDPFMTMTARYADIVLPATTYLETEDFYRSYGSYYMQYAPRAVAPQAGAKSNLQVAQALAQRMGLQDAVFQMSEKELLRELLRGTGGQIAAMDPTAIPTAGAIKLQQTNAQTFATRSGKLEIYSSYLETQNVTPLPDWRPDTEELREAARWPLRLLTAPGYFQSHTAFEGNETLKRREGPAVCILHPREAQCRNLAQGDVVRLHNDRAQVRMIVHVSDEVQPGVVLVPGQRTDEDDEAGTVNMLCSDRFTDIGDGATYQSTYLDVSRWSAQATD